MAYGDTLFEADIFDAWSGFCEQFQGCRAPRLQGFRPGRRRTARRCFRYLTQNLSQGFDLALEARNTRYPAIHAFGPPMRKLGFDNADCIYLQP